MSASAQSLQEARSKELVGSFVSIASTSATRFTLHPAVLSLDLDIKDLVQFLIFDCVVRSNTMSNDALLWIINLGGDRFGEFHVDIDVRKLSGAFPNTQIGALKRLIEHIVKTALS